MNRKLWMNRKALEWQQLLRSCCHSWAFLFIWDFL